jgi:choline dehydrogenase-like flavoprotein
MSEGNLGTVKFEGGDGQPQVLLSVPANTTGPERIYRRLRGDEGTGQGAGVRAKQSVRAMWSATRLPASRRAAAAAQQRAMARGLDPVALHTLYFRTEQAPNRDSRVRLGERRDRLGVPEIVLDWRLTEQDTASITGWLEVLDQNLAGRGLGRVIGPDEGWQRDIIGGPHHLGTTRMSAGPRQGVVDADSRLHSVANLFLAGSSVFPTGGYANPTFTLLALTIRLADRLRAELRPVTPDRPSADQPTA